MSLAQQAQGNTEKDVGSQGKLQFLDSVDLLTLQASRRNTFPSPKLTQAEKRSLLYPYYAGFSETFVASMLDRMNVAENSKVLDPWNGSGTTTLIASMRGARSTGYDLNPVLTIVARARAAHSEDLISAKLAWERSSLADDPGNTDPIEQCAALYERLVSPTRAQYLCLTPAADALILCALFDTLRKSVRHARTRNPSWFASDIKPLSGQPFSEIVIAAKNSFISLLEKQARYSRLVRSVPELHTGDFSDFPVPKSAVDVILTSPPYLTRLDYVKATLPELLLLNRLRGIDVRQLRLKMIGSPLVGRDAPREEIGWGPTALRLINEVKKHPSKASATYYLRFYLKYFAALRKGIERIGSCLTPNGFACLVSQRSHYKEISIDLPQIIAEMGSLSGLRSRDRLDFPWNKSIASINSRAVSANNNTIETAMILEKL